jgi:WD40 repeat protein
MKFPFLVCVLVCAAALMCAGPSPYSAAAQSLALCPSASAQIEPRGPTFEPGGLIWTAFDGANTWVYDIDRSVRYPLDGTAPCGNNCRLSPDATRIIYFSTIHNQYYLMRLNGSERQPLTDDSVSDVLWWSDDRLLVWTRGHRAYLRALEDDTDRLPLDVNGVLSVQPGGWWALTSALAGDNFTRGLIDLSLPADERDRVDLGVDLPYFNAFAWSPDGQRLVYAAAVDPESPAIGSELYMIRPGVDDSPAPITALAADFGAVRVGGRGGGLSWSPDGSQVAFWLVEIDGADPLVDTGLAAIHVLDTDTGRLRAFCDITIHQHTPLSPRLIWSPDGTHLAFGADLPDNAGGNLLIALDTQTGRFTQLSAGLYGLLSVPDVFAWGIRP